MPKPETCFNFTGKALFKPMIRKTLSASEQLLSVFERLIFYSISENGRLGNKKTGSLAGTGFDA